MLGADIVGSPEVVGRGYTPATRLLATLSTGRRVFIKAATNDYTAESLRAEQRIYDRLRAPFLAEHLAFQDGARPVMVLEDLSGAHWPPAWRPGDVAAVRRTLRDVAAARLPDLPAVAREEFCSGWRQVAADPQPFLALNLVSARWLADSLPRLIAATDAVDLSGDDLLHSDLRSDNLCIRDGAVTLVDWNFACIGNTDFDLAFWAPSLAAEGGGMPEELLPSAPLLAAMVSGFFAARAGLPVIPSAPRVRHIQQVQLSQALPWAIRALRLSSP